MAVSRMLDIELMEGQAKEAELAAAAEQQKQQQQQRQ